jgi:hypothetical protein
MSWVKDACALASLGLFIAMLMVLGDGIAVAIVAYRAGAM